MYSVATIPTQATLLYRLNYAKAAQRGLPHSHTSIISQAKLKTQQILVDKNKATNHYLMVYLSEKEIVVKVALAIQLMGDKATDRPTSFRFIGAKKMQ